jgi:hypothetical protein
MQITIHKVASHHALIRPHILGILQHISVLLSAPLLQIIILKVDIASEHALEDISQIIKIKEHVFLNARILPLRSMETQLHIDVSCLLIAKLIIMLIIKPKNA